MVCISRDRVVNARNGNEEPGRAGPRTTQLLNVGAAKAAILKAFREIAAFAAPTKFESNGITPGAATRVRSNETAGTFGPGFFCPGFTGNGACYLVGAGHARDSE